MKSNMGKRLKEAMDQEPKPTWRRRPKILLCPNVPKPMHGVAARVVLGAKWWNDTRRAAYQSTDFHCLACGVEKYKARGQQWLEGHEIYRINYRRGRMVYIMTVPLCHYCHNYIHDGRMTALVEKGQMPQAAYVAIVQHGDEVLRQAKVPESRYNQKRIISLKARISPQIAVGVVAAWENWRLVIDGKEYPPLYATFE